nr:glycine-rich protein 2-like [Aegilops tauschii subsp. strangulata]
MHESESEYNGFISSISTRTITDQPIGLGQLLSLLLAAEARIAAETAAYTANLAAKVGGRGGRSGGGNNGDGYHGYNNNTGGRFLDNPAGGNSGCSSRQGGDRGGDHGDQQRERCQICKKSGHGVWRCKKHYDRGYNNNVRNPAGGGGGGGGGNQSANVAHSYGVDTI